MTRLLALDYIVGTLAHGAASVNHVALQERVLANILEDLTPLVLLLIPLLNVVACRFILEALQNRLILTCNLDQVSFPGLAVQTPAGTRDWLYGAHALLRSDAKG